MKPTKGRAWLIAGLIFVLGVLVGVAGTTWVGTRLVKRALRAFPEGAGLAERAADRIGRNLTDELDLTEAESARVAIELDQTVARLREIRVDAGTQLRAELKRAIRRIAQTLPREKRAAFYRRIGERFERLGLPAPSAEGEENPDASS
tara:strand:- start:206 stop:649 length:444 start_codon:yes stop_codon:yes gene_type:complete